MLTNIPRGLDEIIHTYGHLDDPKFEATHIVRIDFPYPLKYAGKTETHTRCHKLAADNFIQALKNVQAAGLAEQFVEFNGIYARRAIRGMPSHPSLHSWGVAGDFLASQYPLGGNKRWSDRLIKCWTDAGFFYGGNFKSRHDPMHVQLATGY